MIITCPQCQTQYQYDEARFGNASRKRLKCPRCSEEFDVLNPAEEESDSTNVDGEKASGPRAGGADKVSAEPESPELPKLAPLSKTMRYSLAVIAGAQSGSVFKISKPRVYLGRGSAMDIQVQDSEVSRRHCMLEIRDDIGTLVDLGATNGTYLEGERISRVELGNQSEFTMGSTTVMFIVTHDRDM